MRQWITCLCAWVICAEKRIYSGLGLCILVRTEHAAEGKLLGDMAAIVAKAAWGCAGQACAAACGFWASLARRLAGGKCRKTNAKNVCKAYRQAKITPAGKDPRGRLCVKWHIFKIYAFFSLDKGFTTATVTKGVTMASGMPLNRMDVPNKYQITALFAAA